MESLVKLISTTNGGNSDFTEYLNHIVKAHLSIDEEPDVAIERCKSLIEGLCRKIIITLYPAYTKNDDFKDLKLKDHMDKVFEGFVLKGADLNREDGFCKHCSDLLSLIGDIRNKRSDIGHGRALPKEEYSAPHFARLICNVTFGLAEYLIQVFQSLDLAYQEPLNYRNQNLQSFNCYLDELHPPIGKVRYSAALFDQDIEKYTEELEAFSNLSDNA